MEGGESNLVCFRDFKSSIKQGNSTIEERRIKMNCANRKWLSNVVAQIAVLLCFILVVVLGVSRPALAQGTIKLGVLDVNSGGFKSFGDTLFSAVEQAIYEVNQEGGVLGKKVEMITGDTMYKPEVATRLAQKFILEDKVDFLVLGTGSHIYKALKPVVEEHNKILFNLCSVADFITGPEFSRNSFRLGYSNTGIVSPAALYASQQPTDKVYQLNLDYSFGYDMAKSFKEKLLKAKPNVQILEDFTPVGTKNYAPYISKVLSSGARFLYDSHLATEAVIFFKQAKEMGLLQKVIVAGNWDPIMAEALVDTFEGATMVTAMGAVTVDTPANKAFNKRYHERHLNAPMQLQYLDGYGNWEYNGMRMALAGIQRAGSLDTEKVISAMENMEYEWTIGKVTMRACDHHLLMPYYMFKIVPVPPSERFFNFPYYTSKPIATFSKEDCAIAITPGYNPRCK
jgi:branched-chain amino acid transport system substrate-binding protein